jgi:hypothetical protein
MDNPLVKWVLIIVVVGIWVNAIRVSVPAIVDYFKMRSEGGEVENKTFVVDSHTSLPNYASPKYRNIYSLRNPFKKPFLNEEASYTYKPIKEQPEVISFFRLKGIFLINGKKVAVLEGRQEFGLSGVYYVNEGDIVMGERIVEVSDNYVIINKEGKDIRLVVE